jgi:hypothetical protein
MNASPAPLRLRPPHLSLGLLACLTLGGLVMASCEPMDDDDSETRSLNLTKKLRKVLVKQNTQLSGAPDKYRFVELTCTRRCAKNGPDNKCVGPERVDDCSDYGVTQIELRADEKATKPYPATAVGSYRGCGPQAIANISNYIIGYGGDTASVASYTTTFGSGNAIGTTPDDLERAMARALNVNGSTYHLVKRHQANLDEIKGYLLKGFPVTVLVNMGNHYQVVTGWKKELPGNSSEHAQFYVTDYGNGGQWLYGYQLRWGALETSLLGFRGYHPKTFIAINGFSFQQNFGTHPGPGGGGNDPGPGGGNSCDPNSVTNTCPGKQSWSWEKCGCECPNQSEQDACDARGDSWESTACYCRPG